MEYKCLILGDKGVGKSSFIERHLSGNFFEEYTPTNSLRITPLRFQTNQGDVTFRVYDYGYDSKPDCAIIMFDVCNRESWDHLMIYHQWLKTTFGEISIVICGNKVDKKDQRESPTFVREKFGRSPLIYFEISALSNYNFEKPFLFL